MYAVTAQISYTKRIDGEKWEGSRQVPTFYLDENVQGITSAEHAERIAVGVVNPLADLIEGVENVTVHATAVKV